MDYIDFEFDGILGSSIGIFATGYPSIPAAVEKVEQVEIPGKSGTLCVRKKCFEETEITIEFNYIGKEKEWYSRWRTVKELFSARNTTLKFGDDEEFYYRISYVKLETNERMSRRIGKFKAIFVTKDGLSYFASGNRAIDVSETKYNPGIFSQPIYQITGEGMCTITVNGKEMTANVSDNLTIDTESMIAYREDGTLTNTAVKGNYENLYLQAGENTISVTDGFECKIIPKWRCL